MDSNPELCPLLPVWAHPTSGKRGRRDCWQRAVARWDTSDPLFGAPALFSVAAARCRESCVVIERPLLLATRIAVARLRPVLSAHKAFDLVRCPRNRLVDIFRLAACGVRSSSPSSLPDTSALRS